MQYKLSLVQMYKNIKKALEREIQLKCFEGKLTIPFSQLSGKQNQSQGIMTGWLT